MWIVFLLNLALLSLSSLSTEGLDSLSGHWGHQHTLSPLTLRGLAALAQGCDICWQPFFAYWMLSPGLMVAQIPLPKIPFNLIPCCYHQLWSVGFLVSFSSFFFQFPFFFCFSRITSAPRTHLQHAGTTLISDVAVGRGKNISELKDTSIDVPSSQLPSDSLAWTYFSILKLKVISNTWKQDIRCAIRSKLLQWHIWNQCFRLHF